MRRGVEREAVEAEKVKEIIRAPEEEKKYLLNKLTTGLECTKELRAYGEKYGLDDADIKKAAKERVASLLDDLQGRSTEEVLRLVFQLVDFFDFPDDLFKEPQLNAVAKRFVLQTIVNRWCSLVTLSKLIDLFGSAGIFRDQEILKMIETKDFAEDTLLADRISFLEECGASTNGLQKKSEREIKNLFLNGHINSILRGLQLLCDHAGFWPQISTDKAVRHEVKKLLESIKWLHYQGQRDIDIINSRLSEVVGLLGFPKEALISWQKMFLRELLENTSYTYLYRSRTFGAARDAFNMSVDDLDPIIVDALRTKLQGEYYRDYSVMARDLDVRLPAEELRQLGEKKFKKNFTSKDSWDLDDIIAAQEEYQMPQDFFLQYKDQMEKAIGQSYLRRIDLAEVDKAAKTFGLLMGDYFYQELDSLMAREKIDDEILANFVHVLDDEHQWQRFPLTFAVIHRRIIAHVENSGLIAYQLVNSFAKFYQQAWARDALPRAVAHVDAAKRFLEMFQDQRELFNWKSNPRIGELIRKARQVIEKGFQKGVRSGGGREFELEDKFAKDPTRFGAANSYLVDSLKSILSGEEKDFLIFDESGEKIELAPLYMTRLKEMKEIIEARYDFFIAEFEKDANIPAEDKRALLGEPGAVKMNNLLGNVRAFVARYLVQEALGKKEEMTKIIQTRLNNVFHLVKQGFERYLDAYKRDIPLYDLLYQEFDEWRDAGRRHTEVYLGRDGIYAYIGRRAQDAIRQAKMNKAVREGVADLGEGKVGLHPKYLVFPTLFREELRYEVKKEYLEQERVGPDADPIFYDTGYVGSIPEHIMRIMGFAPDEVERRIRLLSAGRNSRRVRRLGENKDSIVAYVEDAPKPEDSAKGLFKDPVTGKISPVAEPASPESQFCFSMIKQAIARHYLVREALHFEPTHQVRLDFEHHRAIVNKEFSKILPPELLSDPEKFLSANGRVIDKEPNAVDEIETKIFSFALPDGTEIIAKRISPLSYFKDAYGEFCVLNSAKKEGLVAAEPVGFLTGKQEGENTYILMKKVSGMSGREFQQYLESGKVNLSEVQDLMKALAEFNAALATAFRDKLGIDKRWKLEDLVIQFDEKSKAITGVVPIDWSEIANLIDIAPQEVATTFIKDKHSLN